MAIQNTWGSVSELSKLFKLMILVTVKSKLFRWRSHWPVVKPAVQNTYQHCRSRKCTFQCMQVLPFLSIFSYLLYPGHLSLLGLQTRPEDRATPLLSPHSSPITRRHSWAPRQALLSCYSQALTKSASRKKWYVLVPLDGFPWFNPHSIALVLLYNMRLERSFSIEQFQSYTRLKITKFQYNCVVFSIPVFWSLFGVLEVKV
jgi:hypothetical protein